MRTHSLTCQGVPEVGQADFLGAIQEQAALWIQGPHLRPRAKRSDQALPSPSAGPGPRVRVGMPNRRFTFLSGTVWTHSALLTSNTSREFSLNTVR